MSRDWSYQFKTRTVEDAIRRVERAVAVTLPLGAAETVFEHVTPAKERLEFLGDRVLLLGVTQCMLDYVTAPDVQLVEVRKLLTSNAVCAAHMVKYDLHRSIYGKQLDVLPAGKVPKMMADTYEALIAAVFLEDFEAGLRLAYDNTREVLAQGGEITVAIAAYVKQHTGNTARAARRNAGGTHRAFDPTTVHAEFNALLSGIAPALEINSVSQERLRFLGESVIDLAAAWRIYNTAGLAGPGVMDNAYKLLLSPALYEALSLQYGLDKALWGSMSQIQQAVASPRSLRNTYQSVIGAYWQSAPHRDALAMVQRDLNVVTGTTVAALRASLDKFLSARGRQAKQVEAVQILNELVPAITRKAQGAVISDYTLYTGPEAPDADGSFMVHAAVASGLVDPSFNPGFKAPSNVPYFAATARAATKQAAKEAAAKALVQWMVSVGLVKPVGDEKYALNADEYRRIVRDLFNKRTLLRKYLPAMHKGQWATVACYMVN